MIVKVGRSVVLAVVLSMLVWSGYSGSKIHTFIMQICVLQPICGFYYLSTLVSTMIWHSKYNNAIP